MNKEIAILRSFSAKDSNATKEFMESSNEYYTYFNNQLTDLGASSTTKAKAIEDYTAYINWFEAQKSNPGLEPCAECLFQRKIRIMVLRRVSDQRLDTVICAPIRFRKIISELIPARDYTGSSYNCAEFEQLVSTGPKYRFTVSYGGRELFFDRPISRGTSTNDVQNITLVLE